MSDESTTLEDSIRRLQQAITAQEALRAVLPEEQIDTTVAALRAQMAQLRAQAGEGSAVAQEHSTAVATRGAVAYDVGGSLVTGDNNHIQHIVQIYQEGGGRVSEERLRQAIANYAGWVMNSYGRIPLRGLSDREYELPDPNLPDVYVSLVAQQEPGRHTPQQEEKQPGPVDMRSLLNQGDRLVITGGPGSGKTTFLRHIAYLLAHAIYTGQETAVRQQLNLTGSIPLPVYLSLGDYQRYRQEQPGGTLVDFISYTLLQQHGVYDLPPDFFAQMLSAEKAICLLLDSLDEVPTEDDRFEISHDILNLSYNRSIRQMLVASRDHAYVGRVMFPASRFRRFVVQPMNAEQIKALTRRWCTAVYPAHLADSQTQVLQAEIAGLEAIRRVQGEGALVNTPLMVTIVAIVHYNERKLPQQRAALYEKCVNALLAEQHKGEEGQGRSQSSLEKRGGSVDAKRGYLALLAFEMMRAGQEKKAGRTVSASQLSAWLLPHFQLTEGKEAAADKLEAFRRAMCDRASLLHERGGLHEFTHLTFQEFLCAYYLAVNRQPKDMASFFQEKGRVLQSWWRETILLSIGYLGKTAVARSLDLVQALLDTFPTTAAGLAAAELAAAGLLELEAAAPELRRQTHDRLLALLSDPELSAVPALRAQAGTSLGRLGDRRPGVCTPEPDLIPIPGGSFLMGDEKYRITIAQPFAIARYPVTNAQYRLFVAAGGYTEKWRNCWTTEGWKNCQREGSTEPRFWDDPARSGDNQPVVGISWYEAAAYANWLQAETGKPYRLPTEAEWERAARHTDGRTYPWGDKWREGACNNQDAGLNRTAAVGVFPAGMAACGAADMAGNVWEWCRTRWGDEKSKRYSMPYRADDGRENLAGDYSVWRVIKGGGYASNQSAVRCASHFSGFYHGGDDYGVRVVASPFPPLASDASGL